MNARLDGVGMLILVFFAMTSPVFGERISVHLGKNADKCDKLAAEEIIRCLEGMTGDTVELRTGGGTEGDEMAIIIGRPETNEVIRRNASRLSLSGLSPEGFAVRTLGKNVLIGAKGPAGVVYGAYALLERLGCRWYWQDELGEIIPRRKISELPQMDLREEPDFQIRWLGQSDWGRRNRTNVNVGMPMREAQIDIWGWYHTMCEMIPVSEFGRHPEWFALIRGRRVASTAKSQYCTSNPEVIRRCAEFICGLFEKNPDLDGVVLGPNDNNNFCECDGCRALDEPGRDRRGRFSRRMVIFYNAVAEIVGRRFPDKFIKVGAYSGYAQPPADKDLRLRDNIILQLCHNSHYCYRHPIADEGCEPNRLFDEYLREWLKRARRVIIYEYYYKASWAELPFPIHRNIARDIRHFKSLGVSGLATQYAADSRWGSPNHGTLGLNYYVAARCLWDSDTNIDALLDDYFRGLYGDAAGHIRKYYDELEHAYSSQPSHLRGTLEEAARCYSPDVIEKCRKYLQLAEAAAEDETVAKRISYLRVQLNYTELVIKALDAARENDLQQCKQYYDKILRLLDEAKDEPIFSKSARGIIKRSIIGKYASIAAIPERDWIQPATQKLPLGFAFLTAGDPTEDEREALRWARANLSHVAEIRVDGTRIPPLDRFNVAWIHSASDELPSVFTSARMTNALRKFVSAGGGLFLSGDALLMANSLGLEPVKATTGHHREHLREIEILPVRPDHPIFAGLPKEQFTLRTVAPGEVWGEPRWTVEDEVHGTVLATRRYPSEVIVEYELGGGKVIVAGTPFYGTFADKTNPHAERFSRLTRNILSYLAANQQDKRR